MRKAQVHKICHILLKQGYRQGTLDEVEFSDVLAQAVFFGEAKQEVEEKTIESVLWDCVDEEAEIGIDQD